MALLTASFEETLSVETETACFTAEEPVDATTSNGFDGCFKVFCITGGRMGRGGGGCGFKALRGGAEGRRGAEDIGGMEAKEPKSSFFAGFP